MQLEKYYLKNKQEIKDLINAQVDVYLEFSPVSLNNMNFPVTPTQVVSVSDEWESVGISSSWNQNSVTYYKIKDLIGRIYTYRESIVGYFLTDDNANVPTKKDGDMCYDVYSNEAKVIFPNTQVTEETIKHNLVGTGVHFKIPNGYHFSVRDRSGLAAKNGLHILAGQIDNSYTGELKVCIFNFGIAPYTIKVGDRIAQIKFEQDSSFMWEKFQSQTQLGLTDRKDKGFGSSGR